MPTNGSLSLRAKRSIPAFEMLECVTSFVQMAYLPLVFRRLVPRPIDLASVRRCSA